MLLTLILLVIYFAVAILIAKIIFWLVGMFFPIPAQIQMAVFVIISLFFLAELVSCFFYGQPFLFGRGSLR